MTKFAISAAAIVVATVATLAPATAGMMSAPSVNPSEAAADATTIVQVGRAGSMMMQPAMTGSAVATNDLMLSSVSRSTTNPSESGAGETTLEQIRN